MLRVVHTALLALLLPVAQCEYVVDERCWAVLEKADVCSDTSPPGGLAERMADCIEIGSACHSVLCTGHNCYALSYAPSIVDHALRISNPTCFKQKPGMMRYLKTCDLQDVEFEHQTPITTSHRQTLCFQKSSETLFQVAQVDCAQRVDCIGVYCRPSYTPRCQIVYPLRYCDSPDTYGYGTLFNKTRNSSVALPETEECSWLSEIVNKWDCETGYVQEWTGLEEAKQACYGMGVECSAVWCRGAYSGQAMQCTPYTGCANKRTQGAPGIGTVLYRVTCIAPEHCSSPCYETEEHTNGECRNACDCTGSRVCTGSSFRKRCHNAISKPSFDYPTCVEGDDCFFETVPDKLTRYGCLDSSPGAVQTSMQPLMQHDYAKHTCLGMADCIGYACETGGDGVVRCMVLTQALYDCSGDKMRALYKEVHTYTAYQRCCGTNVKEQCPTAWAEHLADIATPHPHYTHAPPPAPPIVTGLATIGGLAVFVAATTVWLAYKKRSDLRAVRDEAPDQGQELLQAEPQDEDDVVLA